MWDLPGPGHKPLSPALAGGFLTTVPPGKPKMWFLMSFCIGVLVSELGYGGYYVICGPRGNMMDWVSRVPSSTGNDRGGLGNWVQCSSLKGQMEHSETILIFNFECNACTHQSCHWAQSSFWAVCNTLNQISHTLSPLWTLWLGYRVIFS